MRWGEAEQAIFCLSETGGRHWGRNCCPKLAQHQGMSCLKNDTTTTPHPVVLRVCNRRWEEISGGGGRNAGESRKKNNNEEKRSKKLREQNKIKGEFTFWQKNQ